MSDLARGFFATSSRILRSVMFDESVFDELSCIDTLYIYPGQLSYGEIVLIG